MATDLTGQRFNRLVAKEQVAHKGKLKWRCICDCGNETFVFRRNLVQNHTKSCGCLIKEHLSGRAITGKSHEVEYAAWRTLVGVATGNKKSNSGPCPIDPSWLTSYDAFYQDMGPRPTKRHRLFRKVLGVGYYKENCYWGTSQYAYKREGDS